MRLFICLLFSVFFAIYVQSAKACDVQDLEDGSKLIWANKILEAPEFGYYKTAICACPSGTSLISGGCSPQYSDSEGAQLLGSYPVEKDNRPGWGCYIKFSKEYDTRFSVKVRLLCK